MTGFVDLDLKISSLCSIGVETSSSVELSARKQFCNLGARIMVVDKVLLLFY